MGVILEKRADLNRGIKSTIKLSELPLMHKRKLMFLLHKKYAFLKWKLRKIS